VDRTLSNPAIDTVAFPATLPNWFWSSSPYAGNADGAWDVGFGDGYVGNGNRSVVSAVRLVR